MVLVADGSKTAHQIVQRDSRSGAHVENPSFFVTNFTRHYSNNMVDAGSASEIATKAASYAGRLVSVLRTLSPYVEKAWASERTGEGIVESGEEESGILLDK